MANPGTSSAQGNELELAGQLDASGNKIWINRATNDYIQMASGQLTFNFGGVNYFQLGTGQSQQGAQQPFATTVGYKQNGEGAGGFEEWTQSNTNLATTGGAITQNWANAIPAGALLLTFHARVTTVITGCTSWSVGYTGTTTAFGTGLAVAAGTLANISTFAAVTSLPVNFGAATNIVLTAAGGGAVFTTGAVRMAISYIMVNDFSA